MQSRTYQQLETAQKALEQNHDRLQQLQTSLREEQTLLTKLYADEQKEMVALDVPMKRAKTEFDTALRTFEQAQAVYARQQNEYQKAQATFENQRQQLTRATASSKSRIETTISSVDRESKLLLIQIQSKKMDVDRYTKLYEMESKAANDNRPAPMARNRDGSTPLRKSGGLF